MKGICCQFLSTMYIVIHINQNIFLFYFISDVLITEYPEIFPYSHPPPLTKCLVARLKGTVKEKWKGVQAET